MQLGLNTTTSSRKKRVKKGGFTIEIFKDVFTNQLIYIDSVPELSKAIKLRKPVFYRGKDVTILTKNLIPVQTIPLPKWQVSSTKKSCTSIKCYLSGEQIKIVKRGTDEAYSNCSYRLTFIEG